ncbi:hypothetical protein R1sor_011881 [Riccia sorocarpa]|uniref:Receptor-like serine/threonine-protein kinase n=1 Tax=Riccia sorocarpa TaxID=122646 RepID=A0ABD3I612_9MARC
MFYHRTGVTDRYRIRVPSSVRASILGEGMIGGGVFCKVYYDHVETNFSTSAIRSVDVNGIFLHSINDTFALGISTFGRSSTKVYYLSIIHLATQVVVWTANRNQPVQISDLLYFDPSGNVTLQNSQGLGVWSTDTQGGSWLQLQETGNLVVLDKGNRTLWQSFENPSDTLLSGQKFLPGMKLIANKGSSDFSQGSYSMSMQERDLLLWVEFQPLPQGYWSMSKDVETTLLDPSGSVAYAQIQDSSKSLSLCTEDGSAVSSITLDSYEGPTLRRATIAPDGNLQMFYYSGSVWNLALVAVRDRCNLPESCGPYGFCSNNGQCSCPLGTDRANASDSSKGCIPQLSSTTRCADNLTVNSSSISLMPIGNVNYFANAFTQAGVNVSNLDSCLKACTNDCLCTALFFQNDTGSCFVWQQLGTMKTENNAQHLGFLKVNRNAMPTSRTRHGDPNNSRTTIIISVLIVGVTVILIIGLLVGAWWYHRRRVTKAANLAARAAEDEELMEIPGLPTRFTYRELEDATNEFSKKLGSGGFGSVYEGVLTDKRKIAVKRLESVGQGKKEFWAEVAIIGSIHHVHLVRLLGFCAEGTKRLLVYEFMANGSLDKVLFTKEGQDNKNEGMVLDWATRMSICLGTAQGLAYLHEDCRERIIHCDIKPENILLDEKFRAKVSDFGLAKLMDPEQSEVFTNLRGTRGYLAPEWLMSYAISDKSDVYSFGMVLLELISGRKNFDPNETSEKWYTPIYAWRLMENKRRPGLLADPRLEGSANEEQVSLLMRIALWCIQDEVALRPSMKTVVKMLEGIVEVPNPPSSPTMAVRLHGRKYDTSSSKDSLFHSGEMSAVPLSAPR